MYCVYGKSSWYTHSGPLFGGGPLLGGSVIGGSTVQLNRVTLNLFVIYGFKDYKKFPVCVCVQESL